MENRWTSTTCWTSRFKSPMRWQRPTPRGLCIATSSRQISFSLPNGQVKILDFGLAKLAKDQSVGTTTDSSLEESLTQVGVIPGTAVYMSPEQARSEDLGRAQRHIFLRRSAVRDGHGQEALYWNQRRNDASCGHQFQAGIAAVNQSRSPSGAGRHHRQSDGEGSR